MNNSEHEHTNVNYPPLSPPPYPSTRLVEPLVAARSDDTPLALEMAARAFFHGAMARSPWLQQFVELVQEADSERATGFALGQIAHLGSRCAHEYEMRAKKE